jgi:uncharacterized protein (UPF0333 family)
MAARENQGLQIALIIFVILTIILIVTTYMFFSSYSQERDRAKSLAEAKTTADSAASKAIADAEEIKLTLGGDPSQSADAAKETAKTDMQTYGEGLAESKQNYRALVQHLSEKLREYEAMNTKLTAETKELNEKLGTNEQASQAEVAKYKSEVDKTATDLQGERTKFGAARTEITGQMEQLATKFQTASGEREKLAQQSAGQIAALSGDLKRNEELLSRLRDKEAAEAKANEYPDGEVTRINQRTRLVWINVGPADGLRNQTSFVVVAPEDGNPVKSKPKGKISVVRLTEDHQAEALIIEDDLSNPIMPGDHIFSTVWDAGRHEHFALVGKMDIDADGSDDRQLVHDLITLNGGIVDAEVLEGVKSGNMSIETKYLVQGDRPDAESKDLGGYSDMITESQKLGVKTMLVAEFLDYMGYKGGDRTVNLGRFANPSDFKPRLPEDVQRTIRGSGQSTEQRKPRGPAPQ